MKSTALLMVTVASVLQCVTGSRCASRSCSPPVGDLTSGRMLRTLHTSSSHPPILMVDDPFMHPDTWWSSGAGTGGQEEIRLDLGGRFCLTHVVMVFRSPRPAAMSLERSQDFGRSWETLKHFAHNCSSTFGMPDDVSQQGALCTSRYSRTTPCSGGEVIFRSMAQGSGMNDPYSPEALSLLTLTNLRVRLLKPQHCPTSSAISKSPQGAPQHTNSLRLSSNVLFQSLHSSKDEAGSDSYAIYSLQARGTCLCHGHAELCLPTGEGQDTRSSNVVQGRCVCAHHTAGVHCERCAPLYNDRPWRAANGSSGEPNPCQKCECNGHATSCHFSERVWRSTRGLSGGVCENCQHDTVGRRCQRCRPGYHRHPARPSSSPHTCTRCWCDPVGSVQSVSGTEGLWCHPRSGHCVCKSGVGGTSCSHCLPGNWGFGADGCRPCLCPLTCDPITGHCLDSKVNGEFYNVPIGGKVPDLTHFLPHDEDKAWSKELAVSALHYTGKCSCKEKKLKGVSDLLMKASVLSAHDKGSHAVVHVKVRKVLRSGVLSLSLGTHSLFPLSWTRRGCTCPVLNPGGDYLLAGPEDTESGRLLVTMQSLVVPWTPRLGFLVSEAVRQGCL
ncbi:netrin-4 isoform X2 [Hoplias malabaricus]|uniref:netrin-4 isoform X2 n=1 Tax=Hoplias malabaricus TaxID=27720 RepID=UPI003461E00E